MCVVACLCVCVCVSVSVCVCVSCEPCDWLSPARCTNSRKKTGTEEEREAADRAENTKSM